MESPSNPSVTRTDSCCVGDSVPATNSEMFDNGEWPAAESVNEMSINSLGPYVDKVDSISMANCLDSDCATVGEMDSGMSSVDGMVWGVGDSLASEKSVLSTASPDLCPETTFGMKICIEIVVVEFPEGDTGVATLERYAGGCFDGVIADAWGCYGSGKIVAGKNCLVWLQP